MNLQRIGDSLSISDRKLNNPLLLGSKLSFTVFVWWNCTSSWSWVSRRAVGAGLQPTRSSFWLCRTIIVLKKVILEASWGWDRPERFAKSGWWEQGWIIVNLGWVLCISHISLITVWITAEIWWCREVKRKWRKLSRNKGGFRICRKSDKRRSQHSHWFKPQLLGSFRGNLVDV